MKKSMRILASSVLIALSPLAAAQTTGDVDTQVRVVDGTAANKGQAQVANKFASMFTNLAGSTENAVSLVTALRNGTAITYTTTTTTPPPAGTGTGTGTTGTGTTGVGTTGTGTTGTTSTTTSYTPPTGKMGWGNVKIALGLAQSTLLQAGITQPTAEQLQTALMGGTLTKADGTTVDVKGVLTMRADGMGWGQIAQANGTKLGPVVSSLKSTNTMLASLPRETTGTGTTGTGTTPTTTTTTTAAGKSSGMMTATGKASGITTAGGASVSSGKASSHGITTAGGGSALGAGHSSKGITTAAGVSTGGSAGLVTAGGSGNANPGGNAYGRGLVTGAGASVGAGAGAALSRGGGAGLVSGGGASVSASGVTHGNGGGNGHAGGNGKGKSG